MGFGWSNPPLFLALLVGPNINSQLLMIYLIFTNEWITSNQLTIVILQTVGTWRPIYQLQNIDCFRIKIRPAFWRWLLLHASHIHTSDNLVERFQANFLLLFQIPTYGRNGLKFHFSEGTTEAIGSRSSYLQVPQKKRSMDRFSSTLLQSSGTAALKWISLWCA